MRYYWILRLTIVLAMVGEPAFAGPSPSPWENWKTDFEKISVPPKEIRSGGPPKDGIPSIDDPAFEPVGSVEGLSDNSPVIGLEINGDARAYPLSVLMWHEIANDVVGGRPVAVTYCPLCNAALVFDATLEGKTLDFGTTGRLRKSDLIMYDRQTESWWQQFSGEAIIGTLIGKRLTLIPSRLESFASFKSRFPNGRVLVPNDRDLRAYGQNPYVGYDTLKKPFLYSGPLPQDIPAMERVVIVRSKKNRPPMIVSLRKLREALQIETEAAKLTWIPGQTSALDTRSIAEGREIGNVIVMDRKSGKDVAYDVTFAFVAHAFHPEIRILD